VPGGLLSVGVVHHGIDHVRREEDLVVSFVDEHADVSDDPPAVALGREGDLAAVADHCGMLHIQVSLAVRRGHIEQRDVDRRHPIAQSAACHGDQLLGAGARHRRARPDARIDERADAAGADQ
jgi:hypothetical protein